jgi:hypothetical protein
MFEGTGTNTIPGHAGGMTVTRVTCRTCHRVKEITPTGAVLWKASAQVCSMCHEASEAERLRSYHEALQAARPELDAIVRQARKALSAAKLSAQRAAALSGELDHIHADLEFLRKGDDVHNIHYADRLTRVLRDQIAGVCRELKLPEPKVVLPPPTKQGW